jgi:hypothetical protein
MKTTLLSLLGILSVGTFMGTTQAIPLYQDMEPAIPQRDRAPIQGLPSNRPLTPGYGTITPTLSNPTQSNSPSPSLPNPQDPKPNLNCNPDFAECGPIGPDGRPEPQGGSNPCYGPYCPPGNLTPQFR